jgi:hypothetical protein
LGSPPSLPVCVCAIHLPLYTHRLYAARWRWVAVVEPPFWLVTLSVGRPTVL